MSAKNSIKIAWSASIGSKGQIVIPSHIRKNLNLNTGDDLVILSSQNIIFLVKSENLKDMVSAFEKISNDFQSL